MRDQAKYSRLTPYFPRHSTPKTTENKKSLKVNPEEPVPEITERAQTSPHLSIDLFILLTSSMI